ncbi:unnamed protein product, partial [Mesorhabditis belari]|uniref:Amidase domain-containing protein n=1 Tax=Mesorhabditis belari TaxID=2138241 RepID=A0AAF3FHJ8_9BILA
MLAILEYFNCLPTIIVFYALWCSNILKFLWELLVVWPWGLKSARKQAIARAKQRREQGFLYWKELVDKATQTQRDEWVRISSLGLDQLRELLQKEEITAKDALLAYIQRALQVQEKFNPITEIITEAMEYAEEVDQEWIGKKDKPYLYGVPFSVKSNFHLVGYDCHIGLGKMLEQPKQRENTMVTHLRYLGAVPFCLTNVPQGLLSFVCSNSVYGTTGNPHDNSRTPGGSSGGEACLVTAHGTPFGTGSDVGGSLRIPAALSGCVALKCGQERMVVLHSHGGVPGRGRLGLGFGYFTRSVTEQIELLKETLGHSNFSLISPTTPAVPFNLQTVTSKKPLRIGYFEDDGYVAPVPAMQRAVKDTVKLLRAQGHEMIKFSVPDPQKMAMLVFKNLLPDGGQYTKELYEADVVDDHMKEFVRLLSLPSIGRTLLKLIFSFISPQVSLVCASELKTLTELRQAQEDTDDYKQEFIEYWRELGIDALVCPAFPIPAVKHHWPSNLGFCAVSTTLFNLLDFPAGVVPVGKVTEEDDRDLKDETKFPVGWNLALSYMRRAAAHCEGLPTSVQVVTLPYQEEICLRVMKEIESVAGYKE